MLSNKIFFSPVLSALSRARLAILTVALTYGLALGVGIVMAQTGNEFALAYRDQLVAGASESNPASLALQKGDRWRAALIDFGQNLLLGAVPKTITGLSIIIPYPWWPIRDG